MIAYRVVFRQPDDPGDSPNRVMTITANNVGVVAMQFYQKYPNAVVMKTTRTIVAGLRKGEFRVSTELVQPPISSGKNAKKHPFRGLWSMANKLPK